MVKFSTWINLSCLAKERCIPIIDNFILCDLKTIISTKYMIAMGAAGIFSGEGGKPVYQERQKENVLKNLYLSRSRLFLQIIKF
jgi:hypothetical protein